MPFLAGIQHDGIVLHIILFDRLLRVIVELDYMAEVRISIGCFSSHKLNTLNRIMPAKSGIWLTSALLRLPKT